MLHPRLEERKALGGKPPIAGKTFGWITMTDDECRGAARAPLVDIPEHPAGRGNVESEVESEGGVSTGGTSVMSAATSVTGRSDASSFFG